VGYAGGHLEDPRYEDVTTGKTGHAEAVEVVFDEAVVSYSELLSLFFAIHDPTTLDKQGFDIGSQYRSHIFTHSSQQKEEAEAAKTSKQKGIADENWIGPHVVTKISPLHKFWPAEAYHQQYLEKSGQDSTKGNLAPIQCYGNRGPIKHLAEKKVIRDLFSKGEL